MDSSALHFYLTLSGYTLKSLHSNDIVFKNTFKSFILCFQNIQTNTAHPSPPRIHTRMRQ